MQGKKCATRACYVNSKIILILNLINITEILPKTTYVAYSNLS